MTDSFDVPGQDVEFDFDLPDERGRWGWYKLSHPETMNAMTARRASGLGKVLTDRTALERWSERTAVVGMSQRPDLFSLVHGKDVKRDRQELDKLVADAKTAAGSNKSANLGTAIHGYCEKVDCGRWELGDVPAEHRADVAAYISRTRDAGLIVHPELIERITYVPELDVAGKFDRVFELPDGSYIMGDIKTGSIEYNILEIEVQLAVYERGVNASGIWCKRKREWVPVPRVRNDLAVIVHLPAGEATCTLHYIDIRRGWKNALLAKQVLGSRKKLESSPFRHANDLPSRREDAGTSQPPKSPDEMVKSAIENEVDWTELFASVTSPQEASALWKSAGGQVPEDKLKRLVEIAKEALRK